MINSDTLLDIINLVELDIKDSSYSEEYIKTSINMLRKVKQIIKDVEIIQASKAIECKYSEALDNLKGM